MCVNKEQFIQMLSVFTNFSRVLRKPNQLTATETQQLFNKSHQSCLRPVIKTNNFSNRNIKRSLKVLKVNVPT